MCGHAKLSSLTFGPGSIVETISKTPHKNVIWGLSGMYNARAESLQTVWHKFIENRAIMLVDGFYEGRGLFTIPHGRIFGLCGFLVHNSILIITQTAEPPVLQFHKRMPFCIKSEDFDSYIIGGVKREIDPKEFYVNQV